MKKNKYTPFSLVGFSFLLFSCVSETPPSSPEPVDILTTQIESSPWTKDISNEPIDPNSDVYINSLGLTNKVHPDFGTEWEGVPIGQPFVYVDGNQPKVPVKFLYAHQSDPGPYPIPPDAPIQHGPNSTGDRHVIVVDRDNQLLYEMYNSYPDGNGGWIADSGAIFNLKTNELRPLGWTSADAAGLPIYPLLVKYDEVIDGEIKHALRFTANKTRRAFTYPARHQAGSSLDVSLPPMGMRVRLKANFDISKYSKNVRVILTAMKKYGMILADNGTSWMISGEHNELWDDQELNPLKTIPGSAFEVVKMGELHY